MILCSKLKNGLCKVVTKSHVVTKFNVTKSRLHCNRNVRHFCGHYCSKVRALMKKSLIIVLFRHPVIYYNSNAGQNINKNAILHYLLPVLLVSIVATSPRFFEAKIETESRWENYTDKTTGDLFLISHKKMDVNLQFLFSAHSIVTSNEIKNEESQT